MKYAFLSVLVMMSLIISVGYSGVGLEETLTQVDSRASYIIENDDEIIIGNDHVEIALAKYSGGGIDRIIDKTTGIDLRGNKAPPPILLIMHYWNGSHFDAVLQWDAENIIYSHETTDQASTITIEYQRFRGNDLGATATISLGGEARMAEFGFAVENNEDFIVRTFYYPVIWGLGSIGDSSEGDEIFYPLGDGFVLKNPLSYHDDFRLTEIYPSTASMQIMAHYDPNEAGLYMAADDTEGHPKRLILDWMEWGGEKHFSAYIQHLFPEYTGNEPVLDYNCLLGTFHGDWMDAADIYREWAETTPFVSGGKISQGKDTPEWFSRSSVISSPNQDGGVVHRPLEDIVDITEEFSELTGVSTTHLIFAWEGEGAWIGPNYFPPAAGEEEFKNATDDIREQDNHAFVYMSGTVWRITRDDIGYENWDYFNSTGKPWAAINEFGEVTIDQGYITIGWTSARMDPMTEFWQDTVVDNLLSIVDLGVDVVQIDEFPIGSIYPCYNASHGHPVGYSKEIPAAYVSILTEARTQGRAVNPDLIISMEQASEFYIPYMDTYVSRHNSPEWMIYPVFVEKYGDDALFVPFFAHVYHEYITPFGEPIPMNMDYHEAFIPQMRRSLARAYIDGMVISGSADWRDNLRPDVISLYNHTVRASSGYAYEYLRKGRPLRPPEIDVEDVSVEWYFHSNSTMGSPFHEPSVLNSAWMNSDGEIGHVLINWDQESRSFDMELPSYDLQGDNYSVVITRNGHREVLLWDTELPVTVSLEMEPDDVILLEILEETVFTLELTSTQDNGGWNFVSHNLMLEDTSLSSMLSDMEGSYDRVSHYDSRTGRWYSHVPERSDHFNNLHEWDHTMGLWIRVTEDTSIALRGLPTGLTDITLHPGWNMVGLPGGSPGNHGLPAEISVVGYYMASEDYNIAYDHDATNFTFTPGQGYWLYNGAGYEVTWTVKY
ncbi:MAG: DUF6259 domain-containing protein [Thermoplasmata archaeon]